MPGAPDEAVLRCATDEQRTLITYDRGFGALVLQESQPLVPAVFVFRDVFGEPDREVSRVRQALGHAANGFLFIVSRGEIRQRPLSPK